MFQIPLRLATVRLAPARFGTAKDGYGSARYGTARYGLYTNSESQHTMHRSNYLRLNTDEWRKARMKALVRDDFKCQAHQLKLCDSPCDESRLSKLHVHHIKLRINGGTHDLDNLITLCKHHHEKLHPWMKKCHQRRKRQLKYSYQKVL